MLNLGVGIRSRVICMVLKCLLVDCLLVVRVKTRTYTLENLDSTLPGDQNQHH